MPASFAHPIQHKPHTDDTQGLPPSCIRGPSRRLGMLSPSRGRQIPKTPSGPLEKFRRHLISISLSLLHHHVCRILLCNAESDRPTAHVHVPVTSCAMPTEAPLVSVTNTVASTRSLPTIQRAIPARSACHAFQTLGHHEKFPAKNEQNTTHHSTGPASCLSLIHI